MLRLLEVLQLLEVQPLLGELQLLAVLQLLEAQHLLEPLLVAEERQEQPVLHQSFDQTRDKNSSTMTHFLLLSIH